MVAFREGAGMRSTTGRRGHYRRAARGCPSPSSDGVGSRMATAPDLPTHAGHRGRWLGAAVLLALVLLAILRSSSGPRLGSFPLHKTRSAAPRAGKEGVNPWRS